jgi:hypothetical protein
MRSVAVACASLMIFVAGCDNNAVSIGGRDSSASGAGGAHRQTTIRPHATTVIVVVMEDRDYDLIIGNAQAPFINGTLVPQAALMTDSHAVAHPSQPNYLALFSGSTQGINDGSCPHVFSTSNLGEEVIAAGKVFDGYSESMPKDGYKGCSSRPYVRKHNPWVDFTNIPASSNLIWYDLPGIQPSVSVIVPNLCNDMHECSTMTGDNWLKANLPAILNYDQGTDGLLILTWDEAAPDRSRTNHIATLLFGPMIEPGSYGQTIDHYAVLHTIEDVIGVACTANACAAHDLAGMWR